MIMHPVYAGTHILVHLIAYMTGLSHVRVVAN